MLFLKNSLVAIVSVDFKVTGSSFQIFYAATEKALAQVKLSFRNKKSLRDRRSELTGHV